MNSAVKSSTMSRRSFLQKGSLVIAVTAFSGQLKFFNASGARAAELPFKPHAFLEIAGDDTVTVWVGQTNLGQGTHTGIPMIIAEELDGDWEKVQVKMALAAEAFKSPVWHAQVTGGSSSIRHRWDLLRRVGAAARQMLIETAAEKWRIRPAKCRAENGKVIHPDGRQLTFGQLAAAAGKRPVPENPPLKKAAQYNIIGRSRERLDIPDKVMGKTVYGFDFTLPGISVAMVVRPPRYGAKLLNYEADVALAVKGVIKVITLENRVAVCAENTYAAIRGRQALKTKWSEGSRPDLSNETIAAALAAAMERPGVSVRKEGDSGQALAGAASTLERAYKLPYLAHAQVEPINCSAWVEKDRCRIWIPTQSQTATQQTAATLTGLPPDKVEVMTLPAGGGFGLRGEQDPVVDAVRLSQALKRPVKVVWSREDDFANDYFRPAHYCRIKAGLDKNGRINAWSHQVAAPSVMSRVMPYAVKNGIDPDAVAGIRDTPYSLPNLSLDYAMVKLPVPVGWWRSVGYSVNVFAVESFLDELALSIGRDPLKFRLDHLEKDSRAYKLLSLLADKGKWSAPLPKGRARGLALASCFESFAAHMAEVSVGQDGSISIHKIVCALDCGTAVYPDAIRAQAESGVIMGLSTAFHEKINFADGGVATSNYDNYPVLKMSEVPAIEVYIAENHLKAGGIGEPVFPSLAPAVANAIYKASGLRLRELPFQRKLMGH